MAFTQGPVPLRIKLIQGVGAMAFGVKDSGFSFFLLIFYNQVLGMDAGLVGLALALALLVDAVADPFIGYFSDRTYTKWGRRLPWLYIAPWPLAIMWVILWSPPTGEAPSFLGLLGIAVGVRVLLSACEVPQVSLLPEITADYDERTTLFRYRYLMGWGGGILMMVLAYTVFMRGPDGILEPEGYVGFGIDITDARERQEKLEYTARTDPLTGLANRRGLAAHLEEIAQRADATTRIAFMHVDLDRFKSVNDAIGHDAGDHVLEYCASVLRKATRGNDMVARVGGDEFVVVCADSGSDEDIGRMAVTNDPNDNGRFKTPTLRNVAVTAPYMHNGVFEDLRTVILFYNTYNTRSEARKINPETGAPFGPPEVAVNIAMDELTDGPALEDQRIDALVAFLETLTDQRYEHLLGE